MTDMAYMATDKKRCMKNLRVFEFLRALTDVEFITDPRFANPWIPD